MYWLILLACMGLYVSPLTPELAEGTYVLTRLTETGLNALVGTWLVAPKQVAHVVTPETQPGMLMVAGMTFFVEVVPLYLPANCAPQKTPTFPPMAPLQL